MVDQNSQFYAILTNVGAVKQANADALGIPWKITQMAVGDANGTDPTPNASQTSLLNEWRRAPLNQLKVDDKDASIIIAEQVIPADIGGRWIREIGLYDTDGDLVAVANCAPTYKPLLSQGSGRTQIVRMNLVVSSSSNVQLKIDPSVVLATREFVTEELAKQDFKHSVLAATTGPIVLSGLQTIDTVVLPAGAAVLVKDQVAAKDNGLYVVAAGAWTRRADADTSAKVTPGLLVHVEKGAVNGDAGWQLVTDGPINLGFSALAFEMAFGRTGVADGTYRSVTVDKYGRVVGATNPTTVAGYGLTDVYTKTQIDQALALKANLLSPALTGTPTAPTAAANTNTTQLATTAFVQQEIAGDLATAAPLMDGAGAVGVATKLAREDHQHPVDTTRAPLASPALTGTPTAPTAAANTNTTQLATTAFVQQKISGDLATAAPLMDGAAAVGVATKLAREDHRHPVDTTRAPLASPALTGTPTAPTAAANTNTTQLATTAFVQQEIAGDLATAVPLMDGAGAVGVATKLAREDHQHPIDTTRAPLDSPALTGTPTAPTAAAGSNSQQLANTEFVQAKFDSFAAALSGYFDGLMMANLVASPTTTINVTAGVARTSDNKFTLSLPIPMNGVLQSAGGWTAGHNGNKLDAGVRAASKWYHLFLIRKTADGSADLLFSLSATVPTMPAGYSGSRRIGSVKTDASGNILPFICDLFAGGKRRFRWVAPVMDAAEASISSAVVPYVLSVPTGISVIAELNTFAYGANMLIYFSPFGTNDLAPTNASGWTGFTCGYGAFSADATDSSGLQLFIKTNEDAQIRTRSNSAGKVSILTLGWEE